MHRRIRKGRLCPRSRQRTQLRSRERRSLPGNSRIHRFMTGCMQKFPDTKAIHGRNIMGKTQMRAEKRRPDPGIPRLIRKKRKPDLRMDPKQMPAERKPEPDRRKKQRKLLRSRKRERQIRNRNRQGTLQAPGRSRSMETAFFSSLQERQNIAGNRQFFPELTTNI